ncbi:phosphoglycerate mutase-like protein [Marasmius fiardii PR-910]|nr:phosphoglycerate mutase-like protein [Marasmius fiardii PR-910]
MSTVIGTVLVTRHGDRRFFSENPFTYAGGPTESTPLGEAEQFQLGETLHSLYLDRDSDSHIVGIRSDLVNTRQLEIFAKNGVEGNVVFNSIVALLQGLFPPNRRNEVTLGNGTTIRAPLNGYQYIPVETVEPNNDRSLESWTDCPAFQRHIANFYESEEFRRKARESEEILESFKPFVAGRVTRLENAWNLFDFINSMNTYDRKFHSHLPRHILAQARDLANFHENGVFSDRRRPSGIGNIAARGILRLILNSLERMGFESKDPLKLTIIQASYHPMISLFHELEAVKENPSLEAIPNFSSVIAIELRKRDHDDHDDLALRLKFKNGTQAQWQTLHVFGHRGDVPLREFLHRTRGPVISNIREWAQVCSVNDHEKGLDAYVTSHPIEFCAIFALLLFCVVWFVKQRSLRKKGGAVQLNEKDGN